MAKHEWIDRMGDTLCADCGLLVWQEGADDPCPARAMLAEIQRVMAQQEAKYGPFVADVPGVRLAVAVLEDETAEVRDAWREERRVDSWEHTREEAMQVAVVALRLVGALSRKERSDAGPS